MPVTPPLAVRIISDGASYNIDNLMIGDLSFSNAAPGGYTSLGVDLGVPLSDIRDELSPYSEVEVVDTRSGEQVWYGRLEDPGRSVGKRSLSAVGGSAHASDVAKAVVYNDTRVDQWVRYEKGVTPTATVEQAGDTSDVTDPGLHFAFPRGTILTVNVSRAPMRYDALRVTGQHVARAVARITGGRTIATIEQQWVGRAGPATEALISTRTMQTASGSLTATPLPTLHTVPELRLISQLAATVADDVTWNDVQGIRVVPTRLDRLGAEVTAAASYGFVYVLPHEVIEDVLGRFLPDYDRVGSLVDTTSTVQITQMAYDDVTTAQTILDDLMGLAPTHWWAAWGNGFAKGARFTWQPWPTSIGLDGLDTVVDEFSASGSAADLYNEVTVRYKDPLGVTRSVTVTGECPALTRAGLTRRGFLDMGTQVGDRTQALAAGANYLAAHRYPSNGGTIKVSRPIIDWSTGRRLWPWQIKAGVLARVANLNPQIDDLNPVPNGSTVFRVSDVAYSAKSNTATLTLDSYDRTVARALARLSKGQGLLRRV